MSIRSVCSCKVQGAVDVGQEIGESGPLEGRANRVCPELEVEDSGGADVGGELVDRTIHGHTHAPSGTACRSPQVAGFGNTVILLIAGLQGFKAEVDFQPVLRNRLTITGSTLRPRPVEFKAKIAEKLKQNVWPLLESGNGLPMGVQLVGQRGDDGRLLRTARWLVRHLGQGE